MAKTVSLNREYRYASNVAVKGESRGETRGIVSFPKNEKTQILNVFIILLFHLITYNFFTCQKAEIVL